MVLAEDRRDWAGRPPQAQAREVASSRGSLVSRHRGVLEGLTWIGLWQVQRRRQGEDRQGQDNDPHGKWGVPRRPPPLRSRSRTGDQVHRPHIGAVANPLPTTPPLLPLPPPPLTPTSHLLPH